MPVICLAEAFAWFDRPLADCPQKHFESASSPLLHWAHSACLSTNPGDQHAMGAELCQVSVICAPEAATIHSEAKCCEHPPLILLVCVAGKYGCATPFFFAFLTPSPLLAFPAPHAEGCWFGSALYIAFTSQKWATEPEYRRLRAMRSMPLDSLDEMEPKR